MRKVKGIVSVPLIIAVVVTALSLLGIGALKNSAMFKSSNAASITITKTLELTPFIDSYVSKINPTVNYGSKNTLQSNSNSISYLKFDTRTLIGKKITSVKVDISVTDKSANNQQLSYTLDNSWDEKTISWNKRPKSLIGITSFTASSSGINTINLTPLINGASVTFNYLTLVVSSSGSDTLIFSSKEGTIKPKLIFTYVETTQVTSSPKPTATQKPTSSANPTTKPTSDPGMPMGGSDGSSLAAASFGLWDPNDPKYASSGPSKYPVCTKAFHDSFYVLGPDGKKYPTWHPPVATDPVTGIKCTFGHEHGRDPSKFALWNEVKAQYYFDANKNGIMDQNEEKMAGVPFGYVNEQMDVYSHSMGGMMMRHEDHVGHKIDYVNGEADTAGGSFGSSTTGGIVIPIVRQANGFKWTDSGAKCYYFMKVHQGVHSPDALTNNLHEVLFFADCKGPTASYNQKVAVSEMAQFGASGEFTNLCTPGGDRSSAVVIGKNDMNKDYPGTRGSGTRSIIQRSCLDKYFFVPTGQFSMNLYEEWDSVLGIKTTAGKNIVGGIVLTFDVEDSIRHYDPSKPNNIGYNMDLCYQTVSGGREPRGTCHVTDSGKIKDIKWNDTRSQFIALHRGAYFQGPRTDNAGGAEVWYTDPFGGNAQTTPFAGSIKQFVSATSVNYLNLGPIDPRQNDRIHDDGEGTVHAPN